MNSFNFQIVNVANLAAITTPFPDHICYFTLDTENYYIWENNALKEIFVDASSISWNDITNKPTTINGFGITDAVKVNNGTLNYVAKFTPDGQTIGNSQIRDDGTSVGVFIAPNPMWRLYVNGNALKGGYFSTSRVSTNVDLAIGAHGSSSGVSSQGMNIGVFGQADSNALLNVGVYGTATGVVAGVNIGMYAEASAGTSGNYSIQLKDGTQGTAGWYLRNMTTDGKANWAKINITEVTNGLSSTLLGAPNGIATLDNNSKLVMSQMPISVMDYKGTYDIVTNTPSLVDGVGNQGDVYVCTTAGTRTFGPGNTITVGVGDWLIYNGTKWEKTLGNNVGSGTVTSVGLSLGTAGNDVSVSNSPITSSGSINLNLPSASASARGLLTANHWSLFNDKIGGLGLNNFVAKYTPDGKNIGMSRLYDDNNGFSIGSGASVPAGYAFHVKSSTGQSTGGYFSSHQGGTGDGFGLVGNSIQTSGTNVGVHGLSGGIGANTNIGVKAEAGGATNNYSIQLIDSTQNIVGRYLRNMTTDGKANWANIQVSEVTGAVAGAPNGTTNYVAKWTPNGSTIGNSKIQDNGTNVYIDDANVAGYTASKFYVSGSNTSQILKLDMLGSTSSSPIGIELNMSLVANSKSGIVSGFRLTSRGSSTENRGIELLVNNATLGKNIGIFVNTGAGAGGNYSAQLQDGTQTSTGGKYLKDMGDGKANWNYLPDSAQIMCSDMTSAITPSTTVAKAFWAAPCDGTFTEALTSFYSPPQGSSLFTVEVRKNGALVATISNSGGSTNSNLVALTSTFIKGDRYDIFITAVGDGSARGVLTTLNYLRT